MQVIAERLATAYPEANKDRGARVMTLVSGMQDEGLGAILLLWQASAAFVLLIACANIANLLLARGAERYRDLAVRLALGASRARLVRQMLSESTLLACVAIPIALAVSMAAVHAIRVSMPARIIRFVPGWSTMGINARLFVFTALLALAAAVIFGVVPALQASRAQVAGTLKDGGRGSTTGRQRLRRALVVAEIALSLPLLVAAALSTVGANRFLNGPQGYDADGVLLVRAALLGAPYAQPEQRRHFVDRRRRSPVQASGSALGCRNQRRPLWEREQQPSDRNRWDAHPRPGEPSVRRLSRHDGDVFRHDADPDSPRSSADGGRSRRVDERRRHHGSARIAVLQGDGPDRQATASRRQSVAHCGRRGR